MAKCRGCGDDTSDFNSPGLGWMHWQCEVIRLGGLLVEATGATKDLERQLAAATAIPNDAQIKKWEAFAQAKISVLNRLAEAIIQDEPASSGWLRQQCGLSADEWHGAGELIAALICFGCDKGFLDWHAAGMADIDMPDQIAAARREGARDERGKLLQRLKEREAELRELGANISAHIPAADILYEEAAAIRALSSEDEGETHPEPVKSQDRKEY